MEVIPCKIFKTKKLLATETNRAHICNFDLIYDLQVETTGFHDYALISANRYDAIVFIHIQFNFGLWEPSIDDKGRYTYILCQMNEEKWNSRNTFYSYNMFKDTFYRFCQEDVDNCLALMRRYELRSIYME